MEDTLQKTAKFNLGVHSSLEGDKPVAPGAMVGDTFAPGGKPPGAKPSSQKAVRFATAKPSSQKAVRFAPSPTGHLHLGNIRGALMPYLFAKKNDLKFILRIDDTDKTRSREEFVESIYSDLHWLGIEWDSTFRQSEKYPRYQEVMKICIDNDLVYEAWETEKELEELRSHLQKTRQSPAFKRNMPSRKNRTIDNNNAPRDTFRDIDDKQKDRQSGQQSYWRFDIGNHIVKFDDKIKGEISTSLSSVSDPIICKPNGEFTYTFASIVDDIFENISCIIRGADHITNTAVQLAILEKMSTVMACNEITFAHYPLFTDKSKGKLSKRNNTLSISDMRDTFHPLSLTHYITFVGSTQKRTSYRTTTELAETFDLKNYASSNLIEFNENEIYQWQKYIISNMDYQNFKAWCDCDLEDSWAIVRESIATKNDAKIWQSIIHDKIAYSTYISIPKNSDDLESSGLTSTDLTNPGLTSTKPAELVQYCKNSFKCPKAPGSAPLQGNNNHQAMTFLRQVLTGQNSGPKLPDLLQAIPEDIIKYRLSNYHKIDIKFHNTLSKTKEDFIAINASKVRIYACGPTVYASPHLGNARSFVIFDVLYRFLRFFYKNITYVRNVTDIDDKIIKAAEDQNISCATLTQSVYEEFKNGMQKLNVCEPTFEPKVTEYLPQIIKMIQEIIDSGTGYISETGAYFNIAKFKENNTYDIFDCLKNAAESKNTTKNATAAESDNPGDNSDDDFALWKFRNEDEIGWASPWGWGRPGWHIECSAMARDLLGIPFDIHCGGKDLIFPHHTNECAQVCATKSAPGCATKSPQECALKEPKKEDDKTAAYENDSSKKRDDPSEKRGGSAIAKYWLHNNFINIDEMKMSKSLQNFITLDQIKAHPMIIRVALLMGHYRHELAWSEALLIEASALYNKWRRSIGKSYTGSDHSGLSHMGTGIVDHNFLASLGDDLNTPLAIRILDEMVSKIGINVVPSVLQLVSQSILESFGIIGIKFDFDYLYDSEVIQLVDARQIARKEKDFIKSDAIRAQLNIMNVELEEGPDNKVFWYQKVS